MLESGQRAPDVTAVMALFVSALGLQVDKRAAGTLVELARAAAAEHKAHTPGNEAAAAPAVIVQHQWSWQQTELGLLENVPPLPSCFVVRPQLEQQLAQLLQRERRAALCGLAGMGKSTLAAAYAHSYARSHPVFWLTCGAALTDSPGELLRQLALFVLAFGGQSLAAPALVRRIAAGETPGPLRQQIFVLASEVGQLRAPLFVFDEAHLIARDEQLLELLHKLAQLAPYSRQLFLTREWLELQDLPHLMVSGLAREEASALYQALASAPPPSAAAQPALATLASFEPLYAHTTGSPLLLRLAVSRLEQGTEGLPATVGAAVAEQLVLSLVAPLPPAARLLLDFLAIWRGAAALNEPTLPTLLADMLPAYDHDGAVDQLQRARLIDYTVHATLHPLLGAPLLELLNRQHARRQALHRLAAHWALRQGNPVEAAYHYGRAGDLLSAVELLAGDDMPLAGQAPATATVLEELVDLARQQAPGPHTAALLRQLRLRQGDLWMNTLHTAAARASYREALELSDTPLARAQVAQRLALCLLQIGLAQEALALCEDALSTLLPAAAPELAHLRLQLGATQVRALLGMARFDEAAALCEEGLALARQLRLVKPTAAEEIAANAQRGLGYIARRRGSLQQPIATWSAPSFMRAMPSSTTWRPRSWPTLAPRCATWATLPARCAPPSRPLPSPRKQAMTIWQPIYSTICPSPATITMTWRTR